MSQMHIRTPFAAAFGVLIFISAYLGLFPDKVPKYGQSDKALHFITFFLLTLAFYWILETSRRRLIHLTLLVCTGGLAIGSEIVQAVLPNGRIFDPFDILANVVGSALALSLCSWYHRRMLERRRKSKHYDIVPGDEELDDLEGEERDLERGEGEGSSLGAQESGIVHASPGVQVDAGVSGKPTNVTEELDNWDENAEDWDDDENESTSKNNGTVDGDESKKRAD
ncbi:hypothetical protein K431DRAFT_282884 [Polychaeton citri CBS 116435]|uniref:VanZ-like domain-containing protein n=1 Tax=Polychaeton citri CBS 116435 TaxID=1314669 RepID=A0A9P4QA45_9PEZI|nr:hypothetical protein K431DRAFT_282884 [Polychaeton citri CBS 116435]